MAAGDPVSPTACSPQHGGGPLEIPEIHMHNLVIVGQEILLVTSWTAETWALILGLTSQLGSKENDGAR